jgi:hypothetical protein
MAKKTKAKQNKRAVSGSKKSKTKVKVGKRGKTVLKRTKRAKSKALPLKKRYKIEYDDIADDPSGYKLPPQIKVDGVVYNTPSRLHGLSHKGSGRLNNRLKILIYAIYKKHYRVYRKSMQYICDRLFIVRDMVAIDGLSPEYGSFDSILYKSLRVNKGYKVRNEISDALLNVGENFPWIKKYRFHCFECRRISFASRASVLVDVENELLMFWKARDRYLDEVDSGSVSFSIFFFHEHYTNFVLADFNNVMMESGDVKEFRRILSQIQAEEDYGQS